MSISFPLPASRRRAKWLLLIAVALLPFACAEHQHHLRVTHAHPSPTLVTVDWIDEVDQSNCPWRLQTQGCLIRT